MRKLEDEIIHGPLAEAQHGIDFSLALIVAASAVTRVVVARIAEQAGLRTHHQTPEEALPLIAGHAPAIALLAGGADGRDCDDVLKKLHAIRQHTGPAQAPRLIMLTNRATLRLYQDIVDATVLMPVTPDKLQPVIRDLMDGLQG